MQAQPCSISRNILSFIRVQFKILVGVIILVIYMNKTDGDKIKK
jgi:hypothetical protein